MEKTVKVLHYTTHHEDCGIGRYQEQYLAAMQGADSVENQLFPYSPNQTRLMSRDEFGKVLDELLATMQHCDILHIQYEIGFFGPNGELERTIDAVRGMGKPVL